MSETSTPFWDWTLRRIRDIWPLGDPTLLKDRVSAELNDEDLPHIQKKIENCLLTKGGEVSARARAAELGEAYMVLSENGRKRFLQLLAREYDVNNEMVDGAIAKRSELATDEDLTEANIELRNLLEPPRTRLLRQFNELEEGVKFLVDLREELIVWAKEDPDLKKLDNDVFLLLSSWFDVGFLDLQQITWHSPALVLEKLIQYEAVHKIRSWRDLKNRLEDDRRCYAFFHPRMPEEPLIFVEVALVEGLSANIQALLDPKAPLGDPRKADTAIFYSISNCQKGLAGVSFGNFLIKRVVADLVTQLPNLKQFSTLSPVPGFIPWLKKNANSHDLGKYDEGILSEILQSDHDIETFRRKVEDSVEGEGRGSMEKMKSTLMKLCGQYLVIEKRKEQAYDRVAHFHLTNGARIERINWAADLSDKGVRQSGGLMVNYLYDLPDIEGNHESYKGAGEIAMSSQIKKLVK